MITAQQAYEQASAVREAKRVEAERKSSEYTVRNRQELIDFATPRIEAAAAKGELNITLELERHRGQHALLSTYLTGLGFNVEVDAERKPERERIDWGDDGFRHVRVMVYWIAPGPVDSSAVVR